MNSRPEGETIAAARLRFGGDLPRLLRRAHAQGLIRYRPRRRASIKDVVESLGVPHTEVHGLNVDGRPAGFGHLLLPGQDVEIRPAEGPVDCSRDTRLRRALPNGLRFMVDENVAGLAPLLRALGIDAAHDREWEDRCIAEVAAAEGRVVLSRDRALLKRSCIEHGRLVRAELPEDQLQEVLTLYPPREIRPFTLCLRCNEPLRPVEKRKVAHLLRPKTKKYYDTFKLCDWCGRVYWPGSHQGHMRERFSRLGLL